MPKKETLIKYFFIFLLYVPSISQGTTQAEIIIKLKTNTQGSVQIINNTNVSNPDEIRINTEIIGSNVNTITIDNFENEIHLIWKNKLTTCNSMFKGLIDIIVIDLSHFDSSDATDMQSMFYNCTNLKSINFDILILQK